MKKLCYLCVLFALVVYLAPGQTLMHYGYAGPFPDTSVNKLKFGIVNGGLGVDPAGKVWIHTYDRSTGWNSLADSIDTGGGVYVRVSPVYVYNPNSTPAAFSPVKILTDGVNTDTLRGTSNIAGRLGYGGTINPSTGNFVGAWGNLTYKPGALYWEINYKTGAGVRRILNPTGILANSPSSVAVDAGGEYFLSCVLGDLPGQILNPDGSAGTQYATTIPSIGRAMAVSADGNDVYLPRFTAVPPCTYVYHSDNGSLGPYALKDTILLGMSTESIAIHPTTGYVWVSADRRSVRDTVNNRAWTANTFYAYNPATKAVVDSFNVAAWDPSGTGPLPRGIAFSPTGDTVYVGHFDVGTVPAVARFIKNFGAGVIRDPGAVPTGYTLEQNYPNPFNPSTEIKFSIAKSAMTSLRVFDVLGRQVADLVHSDLAPGTYRATFDASRLSSGTYIYELRSGDARLVKKMMLMK